MRDRFRWFVVLLGLMLASHAFALADQEIGPRQPVEGTVHFDLYRGYLMVARGSAGTVKGLTFLLDLRHHRGVRAQTSEAAQP
jgi:hypothetical protein